MNESVNIIFFTQHLPSQNTSIRDNHKEMTVGVPGRWLSLHLFLSIYFPIFIFLKEKEPHLVNQKFPVFIFSHENGNFQIIQNKDKHNYKTWQLKKIHCRFQNSKENLHKASLFKSPHSHPGFSASHFDSKEICKRLSFQLLIKLSR